MGITDALRRRKRAREERRQAVARALAAIHRAFGSGAILRLGDENVAEVEAISTGSLTLDRALGIGGFPRGRLVEIFGPESSGKTTLALQAIAEAQRAGGTAAFVDAEHALDPTYARQIGVDPDGLLVSQPDTGEQALGIVELLVRSGGIDIVVVDSVAALVPRSEIEGEMGNSHMGLHARLMSQAMRKLKGEIRRTRTVVLMINQIRMKIGVSFGSPETTTGGKALQFYASQRLSIRRIGTVKKGEEVVGARTRVRVVKNKLAPPFRIAEFDIHFGHGVDRLGELIDLGLECGVLSRSGADLSCEGTRIGHGRATAIAVLAEDEALRERVEAQVRARLQGVREPRFSPDDRSSAPARRSA